MCVVEPVDAFVFGHMDIVFFPPRALFEHNVPVCKFITLAVI